MTDDKVFKFGYGSNMSPSFMKTKKALEIFESKPAILKGYKLIFSEAMNFVEPGFANVIKTNESDEIHGVVTSMTKKSAISLDTQEGGYNIAKVTVFCYDGENIEAELYVPKRENPSLGIPSYRYMQILIKGAQEVGLKDSYVEMLKSIKTYSPTQETIEKRKDLPLPEKLKLISRSELSKYDGQNDSEVWTSVMGYVFKANPKHFMWFVPTQWKGKEISPRLLSHFRGMSWEDNQTLNYPKLSECSKDDIEYLNQLIDRCLFYYGIDNLLGYLKEFSESQ